ncbi:hypothetical protein BCR32DRAFT_283303 [Anaeromyces robustus]|uniref:SH3 domain-containing protein n=1 Tax=Anaeromyces robustus TaxID=1754192 RepID=A0A1Y1WVT4_9FUNG|nr:hypothetical protein BCR32DRAFT_283303 [Anaeromyces robustus]|eukprot:ORX77306.1 hypothetical protein BCR32DRAFT_283303 [Anaeromyces robustus]
MKSYIIVALLFTIAINFTFAQYNAPGTYPQNNEPYFNEAQLMEYEREQAVVQKEMIQPEVQPEVQPEIQPQNPGIVPPPAPVPPTPAPEPIGPPSEILETVESKENETKKESSSHVGAIAFTGAAFALIAGVGYKSYRKDSKFELPELPVIPGVTQPKEAPSEVVVEMEVLLSETSQAENYSLAKNRAYKCMVSWTPKQSDEIILRRGDLVCVKECFNDGYTLGRNLSTKFDGVFPTCCLCRPEQNVIGSELIKNGKFTAIPKRVSSKKSHERRARRASRGVSFLSSVPPIWNKSGFSTIPQY